MAPPRAPPLGDRGHDLHARWCLSVQPAQNALPAGVSEPAWLLRPLLPARGGSSVAPWAAPRQVLPGLLLGADAGNVRDWRGQRGLDGCPVWGDGDREGGPRRAVAPSDCRRPLVRACGPVAPPPHLALGVEC